MLSNPPALGCKPAIHSKSHFSQEKAVKGHNSLLCVLVEYFCEQHLQIRNKNHFFELLWSILLSGSEKLKTKKTKKEGIYPLIPLNLISSEKELLLFLFLI